MKTFFFLSVKYAIASRWWAFNSTILKVSDTRWKATPAIAMFIARILSRRHSESKVHFPDLEVCCDWSTFFPARISRRSLGRKDYVTSQKSVCKEGYFEHRRRDFRVPVEISVVYRRHKAMDVSLHYSIKYFNNNNCIPSILNLFVS